MKLSGTTIIIALLTIILCFHTCDLINKNTEKKDRSNIDTLYIKSKDTHHEVIKTEYYPKPYLVQIPGTPGMTLTLPAKIDSDAVVLDYFSKIIYNDSIKNDSVTIYLTEQVYKNELKRLKVGYRITAPTMSIIKTEVRERQLAFLGFDVTGNQSHLGFYPSFYFDTRRGMIGGGYDIINKYYKFGLYGKLKLWKRRKNKSS